MLIASLLLGCSQFGLSPLAPEETGSIDAIDGRTWSVDIADGDYVTPTGLGDLLGALSDTTLLFHATEVRDADFDMVVAVADEFGDQDPCEGVFSLPTADWMGTTEFAIIEPEMAIPINRTAVPLADAGLQAAVTNGGATWHDGALAGVVDARRLGDALGEDAELVCELMELAGGECGPCADGKEACFDLHIEDLYGAPWEGEFDVDAGRCD